MQERTRNRSRNESPGSGNFDRSAAKELQLLETPSFRMQVIGADVASRNIVIRINFRVPFHSSF